MNVIHERGARRRLPPRRVDTRIPLPPPEIGYRCTVQYMGPLKKDEAFAPFFGEILAAQPKRPNSRSPVTTGNYVIKWPAFNSKLMNKNPVLW